MQEAGYSKSYFDLLELCGCRFRVGLLMNDSKGLGKLLKKLKSSISTIH